MGVASGYASIKGGSVEAYAPQIVRAPEREHVRYGYASYWDAMPLTLYSQGSLQIASVSQCRLPKQGTLCAFTPNSATGWYRPHLGTPTFVLVDPETLFVTAAPSDSQPWRKVIHVGPIDLYISATDVTPQILGRPN